jgi:hypothetical protein
MLYLLLEKSLFVANLFYWLKPAFSKTERGQGIRLHIVAPAIDYWKERIEGKKGAQVARMKAVRIFNPLHVLGNKILVSDIDGLKIFKLCDHPEIRPQIEVMKTEVMKYQALADFIKSFEERSNCATLPAFACVLRAVLTNSPNSCPPERLFSIFNATYNDEQKSSHTDYIQLSMQSQFNKRALQYWSVSIRCGRAGMSEGVGRLLVL